MSSGARAPRAQPDPLPAADRFVMGVMFAGWATATEAAAFGVLGALAIGWWSGSLTLARASARASWARRACRA
jgi:TRAP-type mannitol/chloroaromatic compound transport system permease large subunit